MTDPFHNPPLPLSWQQAKTLLEQQLDEVEAGRRGFIGRLHWCRAFGISTAPLSAALFSQAAARRRLRFEPHGKYGYCIFR